MRTDKYTSEAICKCMGLPSFEADPACCNVPEAIRLLLMPSFHPEVCLTFVEGKVSVVCARFQIWRQFEPRPSLTDRAEGTIPAATFAQLRSSMVPVTRPGAVPGIVIDGMPSDLLHFQQGSVVLWTGGNPGAKGDFSAFVTLALVSAWEHISSSYCRNALAEAAEYVGKRLPREQEPQRKPTVETMVLGLPEDREQLLDALRKHHDG
ncbi:hypothetical protein [Ideonella paludis]|uniref:Uncharacterized protein n=1 Tax=Ideonella paludis TaxID=1233411 RepID=A0ABS5DYB7_9BURK|nr:hypothetical protein [Ideonella paludis]MBQ0936142.1 hypothetical protein [Ideonella paludis]